MKEFKIGGKVTISENESYRIIDIITLNDKIYYFACTENKPVTPKIFERIDENEKTYINLVEDADIIKAISLKVLKDCNS